MPWFSLLLRTAEEKKVKVVRERIKLFVSTIGHLVDFSGK